jgi:hypothetical protein
MTLLPTAYLPSVAYCAHWAQETCVVDLGEHYIKRSERNRANILTAGGVMTLTVQLLHANRPQQPIRDMRIDYSKRWQHQHWVAMQSAYKASPYYDHYAPLFAEFYERRYDFLVDYNWQLLERIAGILHLQMPQLSEQYLSLTAGDTDCRPKQKEHVPRHYAPYIQVFSDRYPFVADLSIVDLLFCEGPQSLSILKACQL